MKRWWTQDPRNGHRALQREKQKCQDSLQLLGETQRGLSDGEFPFIAIFSLENLPGSFSVLCRETVVVTAAAAVVVAARKRLANNLPINADLVSNLVSAYFSEGLCGG